MVSFDYAGRVAMVTGGASGIGWATAQAFARARARVVIAARGVAPGEEAAGRLAAMGAEVLFVSTDVRDDAQVQRLVERTLERFGRLDAAFNCAGVGGDMAPLERTNQRVWDDVLATNARGVWSCMRHQVIAMLAADAARSSTWHRSSAAPASPRITLTSPRSTPWSG